MLNGDALVTYTFGLELGKFQVETVQEVSALTMEQDVVEIRQITSTGHLLIRKQPGARKSGEVTITRGLDKSTVFTKWIKTTLENGDLDQARENVTIALKDANRKTVRRIQLSGCWASRWEGPALGVGQSSAATEKVTVTFEDITVE
ncbi:phage tail protein [Streptomyces chrestomyceticus]|uniref:phage tail protein n=1 Tax=Streptomyces chrestomyceticus TaxID=68185 RepID=UPI0019D0B032|nr:phage tail protein [Streptomyces chrestomyceticus]